MRIIQLLALQITLCLNLSAQSNFTEKSGGHCFIMDIPDYMAKTYDLNEAASLQYQNFTKEAYAIAIVDFKDQLENLGMKFLNAKEFYPHIPQDQFPAQLLAAQLYLDAGIRSMERGVVSAGRDPLTGDHRYPALELTRLAVPRRVYTEAHLDVVAESVKEVYQQREKTKGLKMVYEPEYLRFFQARFEPIGN